MARAVYSIGRYAWPPVETPVAVMLVLLVVASLALGVYWSVGLWQIVRTMRTLPTARAGLGLPAPDLSVCVVVPAHNEERTIGHLVASLRGQDHPRMRVVLALDRCTDSTASVARAAIGDDERFDVLEITACPDDWAGKVNAVWAAVTRSPAARDADLLLFADADTTFHPGCVRATAAILHQRGLALLSLMSTLTADRWFEKIVQPAAGLELMYQYPLLRASRPTDRRAFANGQFILFRADAYRRIGGHESVREHLLEDLALAREAARHGLPAALLLADGVLVCRMYETWAEFRRGWRRIYTECANRRPGRLRRASLRVAVVNGLLPIAAVACLGLALAQRDAAPVWATGLSAAVAGGALLVWLAAMVSVYRLSAAPLWAAPLHPFASIPIASILARAARDLVTRTPTQWGGRSYVRESR